MPDPIKMTTAMAVAALVAAAMVFAVAVVNRHFRGGSARDLGAGWIAGMASGYYLGCWWLGLLSGWPIVEARDRFLWLVLPAVLAIECLARWKQVPMPLVWLLRAAIAIGLTRVLLHGSVYLTDSAAGGGANSGGPTNTWLIGLAIGGFTLAVWSSLLATARLPGICPAPLSLALVALASSLSIMLSGYATGGQLGLPLAAVLVGASGAAWRTTHPAAAAPAVGFAVVAIASLLVLGSFFAELAILPALILGASPLFGLVPGLPPFQRYPRWMRVAASTILVLIPLFLVSYLVQQQFVERSSASDQSPSGAGQTSVNDYLNFGK